MQVSHLQVHSLIHNAALTLKAPLRKLSAPSTSSYGNLLSITVVLSIVKDLACRTLASAAYSSDAAHSACISEAEQASCCHATCIS
jgi:hypothetical protein